MKAWEWGWVNEGLGTRLIQGLGTMLIEGSQLELSHVCWVRRSSPPSMERAPASITPNFHGTTFFSGLGSENIWRNKFWSSWTMRVQMANLRSTRTGCYTIIFSYHDPLLVSWPQTVPVTHSTLWQDYTAGTMQLHMYSALSTTALHVPNLQWCVLVQYMRQATLSHCRLAGCQGNLMR